MDDKVSVTGEVTAIVYDKDGNIKSTSKNNNLVLNRGLNYLIQRLFSRLTNLNVTVPTYYLPTQNPFVYMVVGYSTGPVAVSATEASTAVPNANVTTVFSAKAVNGGIVSSQIKTYTINDTFDVSNNIKVDLVTDGRVDTFFTGGAWWDLNVLNLANTDLLDINVTNAGYLTMDLNATSCTIDGGTSTFTVPYVFTYLTGDFDIETQITTIPTISGDQAGICIRDDSLADTQKNNVFIANKYNGSNLITSCGNTTPADGTVLVETNTDDHKFLKITRRTSTIATYSKANVGDSWTTRESYTRSDFSTVVQVGIFTGSTNAYVSKFNYLKINDTYPCMIDMIADFPGSGFTPQNNPSTVNTVGFTHTTALATAVWGSRVNITQCTVGSTDTLRIIYRISMSI